MYWWSKFIKKKFDENINDFIDDDVMNQLLEFDEKKLDKNVINTFMNDDVINQWLKSNEEKHNEEKHNKNIVPTLINDDVTNWWLEFDEKRPDETVIDTFESQISLGVLFFLIGAPLMIIWYYIIRILDL